MPTLLCITVRWVGDRFHGFVDGTESIEWPPSPFRLFQALLAGAHRHGMTNAKRQALEWLERQQNAPELLAVANPATGVVFDHWVPDNDNLLSHRKKSVRRFKPILHSDRPLVHYVWPIDLRDRPPIEALDDLTSCLGWLGWAVDPAFATATVVSAEQLDSEGLQHASTCRFWPAEKTTRTDGSLRVARTGTIAELERLHDVNRASLSDLAQRPGRKRPKVFDRFLYTSVNRTVARPFRVFELRNTDGSRFRYPHRRLIHIAGMVRHLAIEAMKRNPPRGADPDWAETYVAGHRKRTGGDAHRQLSYIPLPSTGTEHTDPGVRRVMIVAPCGDADWLDHVARRLAGQPLEPARGDEFGGREPPILVPVRHDNVARFYTEPASVWHTFTPVILPGYDDRRPQKTRALIERALAHCGIEQPCDFEWSAFSRFAKSFPAYKCDRARKLQGYVRPPYLLDQTAVHLTLRFHCGSEKKDPVKVPGPIAVGAGRHCGLGVFVGERE